MEDEKKKKRNKKKKNKQNNKRADDAIATGTTTTADENHIGYGGIVQISGAPVVDEVQSSHQSNAVGIVEDSGVENKSRTSEALLEETVKQLRDENGSYLQKEAGFEENVRRLETENKDLIQKQALLEERFGHLKTENEAHLHNEARLEERLLHMSRENEAHIQNEARLEERLLHLETENESHKQNEKQMDERLVQYKTKKEVLVREMSSTEAKMRQLLDEKSTFTEKEKSSGEMISSLNSEIARLRAQVMELKESRSNLLEQNQSLGETVSNLQVRHENHGSNVKGASEEELNSQIEAACALVEKLITENSELVEKVNELCIKLDQSQHASHPSTEGLAIEVEKPASLEEISIHDELIKNNNSRDMNTALVERNLTEGQTEETVPLSLNPNGEVDVESQVVVSGEDEASGGVALVEAPLIGAPFRLVSFVARYVSGADLAEKI